MHQIRVDIRPLPSLDKVEALWLDLQARTNPSFFTSWSWMGAWLSVIGAKAHLHLCVARRGGQVIGLGVFSKCWRKRGPLPICEAWYLNATGDLGLDKVWIEHNDLLIDARYGDDVRQAVVQHWKMYSGAASELHLPGLMGSGWSTAVDSSLERVSDVQSCGGVGLQAVRDKRLDFTPLVSSHARRFIRRSMKEYQAVLGPLTVSVAQNVDEAQAYLQRLAEMHDTRRGALGGDSVFANPVFMDFHRRLIASCLPGGEIQLLRVCAGGRDVGVLYSFIRAGRVYVYQSGFDYQLIEKHGRPGLVTHTLAIQHNAELGHEVYDLMAGDYRYKTTLSTIEETMSWVVLRKPAIRFRLEDRIKGLIQQRRERSKQVTMDDDQARPDDAVTDHAPLPGAAAPTMAANAAALHH